MPVEVSRIFTRTSIVMVIFVPDGDAAIARERDRGDLACRVLLGAFRVGSGSGNRHLKTSPRGFSASRSRDWLAGLSESEGAGGGGQGSDFVQMQLRRRG